MRYICLFFCLLTGLLSAQTITISEEIPLNNDVNYSLIGNLNGQTLLFGDRSNARMQVKGFNEQLQLSWEKDLEFTERQPKVVGVFSDLEAYFYVLYRFRKKGDTRLRLHRYDAGANLVDSSLVFNYGSLFYAPQLEVYLSDDRSKMLAYYVSNQSRVDAVMVDLTSMETLWQRRFEPRNFIYSERFVSAMVTNEGDLHFALERDNTRGRRDRHRYEVHWIKAKDPNTVQTYDLHMHNWLTFDVRMDYDNLHQQVIATGLYSDKNTSRAMGYFYLAAPPENPAAGRFQQHRFDDALVSALIEKEIKENRGLSELYVQDLILRQDGGALLICERARQFDRNGSSFGGRRGFGSVSSRLFVDYYYDEVVVFSIHPDGKNHWSKILPKKQYSQDDGAAYSSYFLFQTDRQLRFLFNDEIRPDNTVSEYIINGSGQLDRNSLLSTEKLEIRLRFNEAVQYSPYGLIIPSERRNRLKLVKLEYDEPGS